ncbi:MAG: winged helix-turn-helix domain-containing protein [Chloroflexi bacterium]|nr:winged helix-turn-helix domain-containing protein [Chloroflexota bacterium]
MLDRMVEYPLTLLKAEAGYGKTTAVATYLAGDRRTFWLRLGEGDADPLVFMAGLIRSFQVGGADIGQRALASLDRAGPGARRWAPALDLLIDDLLDQLGTDAFLVLDDYHLADRAEINAILARVIEEMPPTLHIITCTRHTPALPLLARWRAVGDVLEIGRDVLAFTADETADLLRSGWGLTAPSSIVQTVVAETEGWIIALQLVCQSATGDGDQLANLVHRLAGPDSPSLLFDYLAEEVYAGQTPDTQDFLVDTSVLRQLDVAVCQALLGSADAAERLRWLADHSLFIIDLGEGVYRYHHLFHEFLARRGAAQPDRWRRLHHRAADIFLAAERHEDAIHHLFEAADFEAAARSVALIAVQLLHAGRFQTLSEWLAQLPAPYVASEPSLMLAQGHLFRLTSRFEEAVVSYRRARRRFREQGDRGGEVLSLEGEALVYLDTVQPRKADPLLSAARRLFGRTDRCRQLELLGLVGENLINAGRLSRAERVERAVAHMSGREREDIDPRIYVRDGRLIRAKQMAERAIASDHGDSGEGRSPRSHRESSLVLAWISALTGDAQAARRYAEQGLAIGRQLGSPIVEVLAMARLGHGWLMGPDADPQRAARHYRDSLELAERLRIPRFRVEALLGLTLVEGMTESRAASEVHAGEAAAILRAAGDEYLLAAVELAQGVVALLHDVERTPNLLSSAAAQARACGDQYLPALADVWLAMWHHDRNEGEARDAAGHRVLTAIEQHGYDWLFTRSVLLGPRDAGRRADLLRALATNDIKLRQATRLLAQLSDRAEGTATAGPPIRVQTLGAFRLWRHDTEVPRRAWGREKALQLFQLLLTSRGTSLHREQIIESLWPEASPGASSSGLRVALSSLRHALEPERSLRSGQGLVRRDGPQIGLGLEAFWIDSDEFLQLIDEARRAEVEEPRAAIDLYRRALNLYQGDYLEDSPFEAWAAAARDRLQLSFITASVQLAELLLRHDLPEEAAERCLRLLERDPDWEPAYLLLMRAYLAQGNRMLALRTYERAAQRLRDDLDIDPSPELQTMRDRLARPDPCDG